jgi:hypothetical protein
MSRCQRFRHFQGAVGLDKLNSGIPNAINKSIAISMGFLRMGCRACVRGDQESDLDKRAGNHRPGFLSRIR